MSHSKMTTHSDISGPLQTEKRHALLYFTHIFNTRNFRKFEALRSAFQEYGDVFTISYIAELESTPPNNFNLHLTTKEELNELGYSWMHENLMPGHANYPAMHFALKHPEYASYTVIEYDVEINGSWKVFFDHLMKDPHDLAATHLASEAEQPQWHHWKKINLDCSTIPKKSIPNKLRCFGPIYRLSAEAVKTLHQEYKNGVLGHYEALMPTLLHAKGLCVRDMNEISHPDYSKRDRWYTKQQLDIKGELKKSSMRFRPNRFFSGWRRNTLYHPVKFGKGERLDAIQRKFLRIFKKVMQYSKPSQD